MSAREQDQEKKATEILLVARAKMIFQLSYFIRDVYVYVFALCFTFLYAYFIHQVRWRVYTRGCKYPWGIAGKCVWDYRFVVDE